MYIRIARHYFRGAFILSVDVTQVACLVELQAFGAAAG